MDFKNLKMNKNCILAKANNINLTVLQLKLEAIHGGNSQAPVCI
ncbi:MAG: hypothetical protein JWR61_2947 [Ferruginibacter sp.]|nr:hypothetical protein [Ferruginibacter sp.]